MFVATAAHDLRASFNGLWAAAQQQLGEDPKSGALFVFGNKRHNRIKILYFDGTGVCILAKRLEKGTFSWPQSAAEPNAKIRLAPQALLRIKARFETSLSIHLASLFQDARADRIVRTQIRRRC